MKLSENKLFKVAVYFVAGYILLQIILSGIALIGIYLHRQSAEDRRGDFVNALSDKKTMDSIWKKTNAYHRFITTKDRDSVFLLFNQSIDELDSITQGKDTTIRNRKIR